MLLLQANFQGTDLGIDPDNPDNSPESARLWFNEFVTWDAEDATPAVYHVIRTCEFLLMKPFMDRATEIRQSRLETEHREHERRAVLEVENFIEMSPIQVREALRPYWESVGADRETSARLERAGRTGDVEAKIAAARDLVRRQLEREATKQAVEGKERPPRRVENDRVMTTACGARAGTPCRWDEKLGWVCPNCGSPVAEGCSWKVTA